MMLHLNCWSKYTYVIVYKILAYLYVQLKYGDDVNPDMLKADGRLFQINERYWLSIIENMLAQGFITGPSIVRAWGGHKEALSLETGQITPAGIAYLCGNSLMEKAKQFLKDIKEITPFI